MSPSQHPPPMSSKTDDAADLAQAYKDLVRGEQAATALEANLTNLESKLDALLAAFEAKELENAKRKDSDKSAEKKQTEEKDATTDG